MTLHEKMDEIMRLIKTDGGKEFLIIWDTSKTFDVSTSNNASYTLYHHYVRLPMSNGNWTSTYGSYMFKLPFDITNIKTIVMSYGVSGSAGYAGYIGIGVSKTSGLTVNASNMDSMELYTQRYASGSNIDNYITLEIDVTDLTGEYYVYIGHSMVNGANDPTSVTVDIEYIYGLY